MAHIPEYTYGTTEAVYHSSGSTVVIKAKETTEADYRAYMSDLLKSGFTVYAETVIAGNLFTTLASEDITVNFYYIPKTGVTRVVYEDKAALYPLTDAYEDKGVPCLITSMKGETCVAREGMGFIIRLRDGSFVIIDGGMGDPDSVDSDKLMNILREQTPAGEKPVVAAWLFTHLHGDHIGVFNCFSLDHHADIELQSIYCNFPKDEETALSDSPYMLDDSIYRYNQFRKNLTELYPDVPVIRPHTGNRFMIRNAQFEVLSTLEDIVPKTIIDGGMNECSVLYRMTLEGQTVLWTGDIAFIATDVAIEQFGNYLKADILQMAHHGVNGTIPFYSLIDPTYVFEPLWPGENEFEKMMSREQNQWLVQSPNVRQIINTGYGTWTVPMPYDPADGTFDRVPDEHTKNPTYAEL